MKSPILITGATGNVGSVLVQLLHDAGHAVRAAVVSEAEADYLPEGVDWVKFDFTDLSTYATAFVGVEKMFLMRPPHISQVERDMKPAIDYAAAAGVQQIVFLSLLGVEKNSFVPHAKVEALLEASSVPYTLLRCGFFMQNLSTTHRQDIIENNDIFIPAGTGKTAFIDVRDIAAVAAKVLIEPGHAEQAYSLTGSEALNYCEVAAMMSEALGRPICYSKPSFLRFAWRLWRRGFPLSYVTVVTAIYLTTRLGLAETVTHETAVLLGRPPLTMQQFISDYAPVWQEETAVIPHTTLETVGGSNR
jgi:uncharacterized protein YbjT (DUF2867 family)